MSVGKIQEKIIANAKDEALEIMKVAQREADKIMEKAAVKSEKILEDTEIIMERDRENIFKRKASIASIDGRKSTLLNKQNLINRCFEEAIEKIISMDREEYINMLINLSSDSELREGYLTFNEKEKDSIGQEVVSGLNKKIGNSNFILDENTASIKGGYFLSNSKIRLNNSIEAIVNEKKKELISEVSKILFD